MGNKLKNINTLTIAIFFALCASSYWSTNTLIDDNPQRLINNRLFDYQVEEDFGILRESPGLGEKQNADSPDRKEIGPLPDGTFISAYTKEGTLFYNEPYKYKYNIDDPYWVQEPYYDRYGFLQYRTVTKYNRKTYWGTSYRQKECKYVRNFSIYDISDKIWLFSQREMYGTAQYSGTTSEGLGNDGHGYNKFLNTVFLVATIFYFLILYLQIRCKYSDFS